LSTDVVTPILLMIVSFGIGRSMNILIRYCYDSDTSIPGTVRGIPHYYPPTNVGPE